MEDSWRGGRTCTYCILLRHYTATLRYDKALAVYRDCCISRRISAHIPGSPAGPRLVFLLIFFDDWPRERSTICLIIDPRRSSQSCRGRRTTSGPEEHDLMLCNRHCQGAWAERRSQIRRLRPNVSAMVEQVYTTMSTSLGLLLLVGRAPHDFPPLRHHMRKQDVAPYLYISIPSVIIVERTPKPLTGYIYS